ncbi:hypothetical protein F0562_028808 [Nyssa sinensis]|uniref:Thioredoxin domain-containing protein n=1 Tax=Nyssa sinensis TaxID=561372 RepID=A0A5J5B1C3_9ASTE|nr:hypothetical protein F0562_028808 [Nyssa sinensis]
MPTFLLMKEGALVDKLVGDNPDEIKKRIEGIVQSSHPSAAKCGRNRCNCLNGNGNDNSEDEFDISSVFGESNPTASFRDSLESLDTLKVSRREDDGRRDK